MKTKNLQTKDHEWHFIQTGGLMQLQISSIDDVLHLKDLNPKLWVALACPVKGLEFSEETLSLLDTDYNGRVRVPEILEAVEYIRTYLQTPEVIMTEGSTIPLSALSDAKFACGHSPAESARSVLHILGKEGALALSLDDVSVTDKLFSPAVINGDGVLPAEAMSDEVAAAVIRDIIACTGGKADISGVQGITREQFTTFFADLRARREWRDKAHTATDANDGGASIFFLQTATDSAANAYMNVRDKINEYYLRCSLDSYNSDVSATLRKREETALAAADTLSDEQLAALPLALCDAGKTLPFGAAINPIWKAPMAAFIADVVTPMFGEGKTRLTEAEWQTIETAFAPYMAWYRARPANSTDRLSFGRVDEILSGDAEQLIAAKLDEEDKHPPIALATVELRKLLLYRRDFVRLLRNFVSFEDFYSLSDDDLAVFQCGTLYIDGRSCDLCFRVLDGSAAKHATMSPLSQCFLLYCDCVRPSENKTMQIAALVSAGSRDSLIVGRNGLFYDRAGNDWDATITKIVENPISIREAFWMPYKKLSRMIQERIAKQAAERESGVTAKLAVAVDKPTETATATAVTGAKKFDVGTIAALGVAVSGCAAVIGTVLGVITRCWWMPPVFIVGLLLLISLPSMVLAWLKLRQRNIAPVLDASGWAVNGNVKINITLGALLTQTRRRPKNSRLNPYDPYADKGFPVKRVLLCALLLAMLVTAVVIVARNNWSFPDAWESVQRFFGGLFERKAATMGTAAE